MNSIALTMPTSLADDTDAGETDTPLRYRARFSALMREHHRELLVYARALTGEHHGAQDVVQDALVSAFRNFAKFDESEDFAAWMRGGGIRFKVQDWFRRQGKLPLPKGPPEQIETTLESWQIAKNSGSGAVFDALEGCLKLLPDRLSQAVKSVYFRVVRDTAARFQARRAGQGTFAEALELASEGTGADPHGRRAEFQELVRTAMARFARGGE